MTDHENQPIAYKRKPITKRVFDDAEKEGLERLIQKVQAKKDRCKGEQSDE